MKIEDQIQNAYNNVPLEIRGDLHRSIMWAVQTLTDYEGSGHEFNITVVGKKLLSCSFAKPEWGGDHSGRGMETASESIVMAVCEYIIEQTT